MQDASEWSFEECGYRRRVCERDRRSRYISQASKSEEEGGGLGRKLRRSKRRHPGCEHLGCQELWEEMVRLTIGLSELWLKGMLDEDGWGNLHP